MDAIKKNEPYESCCYLSDWKGLQFEGNIKVDVFMHTSQLEIKVFWFCVNFLHGVKLHETLDSPHWYRLSQLKIDTATIFIQIFKPSVIIACKWDCSGSY